MPESEEDKKKREAIDEQTRRDLEVYRKQLEREAEEGERKQIE